MRFARPCLEPDCDQLTVGDPRCPAHAAARHQAAYGGSWPALSRAQRARTPHCTCQGCSLHVGPCTSTDRLTLDHSIPVALGGTAHDGTRVYCMRCNAAKRDRLPVPARAG